MRKRKVIATDGNKQPVWKGALEKNVFNPFILFDARSVGRSWWLNAFVKTGERNMLWISICEKDR